MSYLPKLGKLFITCQDQSRFCEKPSQNYIWDKGMAKNPTKSLDNLVIYLLHIIAPVGVTSSRHLRRHGQTLGLKLWIKFATIRAKNASKCSFWVKISHKLFSWPGKPESPRGGGGSFRPEKINECDPVTRISYFTIFLYRINIDPI
jgi:hypothetical protein